MLIANLLGKKRRGESLTEAEIRFLIEGYLSGEVPDYQMSAFTMAVCCRSMTETETLWLTQAMLDSGLRLSTAVSGDTPRVDKHSTGGLGDKVSLILAPLLAACGLHVPMISGRGLGITGGTLDKLEAIDGFNAYPDESVTNKMLQDVGAFIIGANDSVAPADRKLYALRDVTGTVESVPLITSSILSKKLSASLDSLSMDVKVGSGAFMPSLDAAKELAESIVRVGKASGLATSVIISDMDQPLGRGIGNAIEVNEALRILKGELGSDSRVPDRALQRVRELTIELCVPLLTSTGVAADQPSARRALASALDSGEAMSRFAAMIAAQGGRLPEVLPVADGLPLHAARGGYVQSIDCRQIGETVIALGGGRRKLGDAIDPSVGIEIRCLIGDRVEKGEPILSLHCHADRRNDYLEVLKHSIVLSEEPTVEKPLIYQRF